MMKGPDPEDKAVDIILLSSASLRGEQMMVLGMLLKAAEDFNIDLSLSYMIGDSDNDMAAGSAAGCKCIRIDRDGDLLKAVKQALNKEI